MTPTKVMVYMAAAGTNVVRYKYWRENYTTE